MGSEESEVHAHLCNCSRGKVWRPYPGMCCSCCRDGLHNPGVIFESKAVYDEFVEDFKENKEAGKLPEPASSDEGNTAEGNTEHLVTVKLDLGLDGDLTRQAVFDLLQSGSLNARLEEFERYKGIRKGTIEVVTDGEDRLEKDQEDFITRRRKALEQIVRETEAYDRYILEEDAPGSPEDYFIARLRKIAIEALR